ncbi:ABC transporter ATP-binding protein [Halalkalibacter kiskunsagensis]|uniref:ABC transporter ATP-binding protein n=1 Tax=Halalkalibacter kiskunsagensis TaxID=1548599 RepID=A0ABV6KH86_9BACI
MTTKISIRDVSKSFLVKSSNQKLKQEFTALSDINLDIDAGEFIVLVGPSGCGKSTLLDLIGGLTSESSGTIQLNGETISGPALNRGIVFQQYALFPWLTALGNVTFGLEVKGYAKKERTEIAKEYLSLVGLDGFEDRYPHELSGGMKQRVAIARSLAYDPDVLLMDEPFAALDAQTRETLQEELLRIWKKTKKTIIFITHGIDEAVFLGQRVAVMTSRPGRIKKILDIPINPLESNKDIRSLPEFGKYRHEIWSLLHEEIDKAQKFEKQIM